MTFHATRIHKKSTSIDNLTVNVAITDEVREATYTYSIITDTQNLKLLKTTYSSLNSWNISRRLRILLKLPCIYNLQKHPALSQSLKQQTSKTEYVCWWSHNWERRTEKKTFAFHLSLQSKFPFEAVSLIYRIKTLLEYSIQDVTGVRTPRVLI